MPENEFSRFLGGSPGTVLLRLIVMSLIVGAAMGFLNLAARNLLEELRQFIENIWAGGLESLRTLVLYVAYGAIVVVQSHHRPASEIIMVLTPTKASATAHPRDRAKDTARSANCPLHVGRSPPLPRRSRPYQMEKLGRAKPGSTNRTQAPGEEREMARPHGAVGRVLEAFQRKAGAIQAIAYGQWRSASKLVHPLRRRSRDRYLALRFRAPRSRSWQVRRCQAFASPNS